MRPIKLASIVSLTIIVCINTICLQTNDLSMVAAQSTATNASSQTNRQVEQQIVAPSRDVMGSSSRSSDYKAPLNQSQHLQDSLETSPSVTSVHQVWTSSSSGSLDELSPEIISKLRNDVPFLAAYATRPRLVGAGLGGGSGGAATVASTASNLVPTAFNDQLASSSLDAGSGSSPRAARQSLLPSSRLGDFSELAVETSSLSKSEHHHRRRTSLKKKSPTGTDAHSMPSDSLGRRQVLAEASRLVVRKNALRSKGRPSNKGASGSSSKATRKLTRRQKLVRNQRRKKLRNSQRLSKKQSTIGRRARFQESSAPADSSGVKGGKIGGANKRPFYASKIDPTKPELDDDRNDVGDKDGSVATTSSNPDASGGTAPKPIGVGTNNVDGNQIGDDDDGDGDEDYGAAIDEETREPKRVGDPDVDEEEGDTVLVEPKSDGVDDDPELPAEEEGTVEDGSSMPAVEDSPEREDRTGGSPTSGLGGGGANGVGTSNDTPLLAEGDQRGKRVNRERQNPARGRDDEEDADDDKEAGVGGTSPSLAGGGGIGGTIGGANGSQPKGAAGGRRNDGRDDDTDDDDGGSSRHKPSRGPGAKGDGDHDDDADDADVNDRRPATGSGVEFAKDEDDIDDKTNSNGSKKGTNGGDEAADSAGGSSQGSTGSSSSSAPADGGEDQNDFGKRNERPSSSGSRGTSGGDDTDGINDGGNGKSSSRDKVDDDADVDLDYRDEIMGDQEKGNMSPGKEGDRSATLPVGNKPSVSNEAKDCDDGSYKHHDEKYHDEHHQTSDWLRGSIPGEPEDDYPTLSRVNSTNFKCSEQKYPGYYADVETRCQVFHICQADGRQDSFLCSNGTIFSQKTLVCVWWNGFDCEDAPKYYHLNALLYKRRQGNEMEPAASLPSSVHGNADDGDATDGSSHLRPLGGGDAAMMPHLRPRDMALGGRHPDHDDEDSSSIESLIETMKQRGKANKMSEITPDDEATIQRKSTNALPDDDAASDGSASRLRARAGGRGIPRRRKRLAGTRQAPPKLKSRRVSRNSRRRKLRHGIKPKRRA